MKQLAKIRSDYLKLKMTVSQSQIRDTDRVLLVSSRLGAETGAGKLKNLNHLI